MVAADKGENRQAIDALRRAIELNPSLEEGYAKLIEILLRENRGAESLVIGREFVRRFPESREAHYWLGQTYLQLERYEEAVAAHEAVLEHHPDWTLSYYSLSVAHARLGNRDAATNARPRDDDHPRCPDVAHQSAALGHLHAVRGGDIAHENAADNGISDRNLCLDHTRLSNDQSLAQAEVSFDPTENG